MALGIKMKKGKIKKSVLITGVTGQDGAFLSKLLLNKGYKVFGTLRRGASPKTERLKQMQILDKIVFVPMEITEFSNVIQTLSDIRPDFIYNLAAQSFVVDSFRHPIITNQTNYVGVLNILESIRVLKLDTKLFQPSTSEMYGQQRDSVINEESNFNPSNPYGLSKYSALQAIKIYRDTYNLRASSAIMFNHESELRGKEFVTRKITYQLAQLKLMGGASLQLGSLSASRDWGYAGDYVKAISLIMDAEKSDDFVVATNTLNSVRDFFKLAAQNIGFEPQFEGEGLKERCYDKKSGKILCEVNSDFFRDPDMKGLTGDFSKIKDTLGWGPSTTFEDLVEIMSISDLKAVKI